MREKMNLEKGRIANHTLRNTTRKRTNQERERTTGAMVTEKPIFNAMVTLN